MFHRRSLRLADYAYDQSGAYFITISTFRWILLFEQSDVRAAAVEEWERSATLRPEISLDAFLVMPNHVHGIAWLDSDVGAQRNLVPAFLGAFVRAYKAAVTRRVNRERGSQGAPVWQRNYYEHVIRSEAELDRIGEYVASNPARWAVDRENPRAPVDPTETDFWRSLEVPA